MPACVDACRFSTRRFSLIVRNPGGLGCKIAPSTRADHSSFRQHRRRTLANRKKPTRRDQSDDAHPPPLKFSRGSEKKHCGSKAKKERSPQGPAVKIDLIAPKQQEVLAEANAELKKNLTWNQGTSKTLICGVAASLKLAFYI